ncbi:MAG: ABC transporter ATP-binding protein [Clostridia bacterium]|nr:ABC transporter ATP-binding protein [Clostridia bacterium]
MNAFEIKNMSKRYSKSDRFELKNVSLTLPSGCIMGLIGENGAGKTTLINAMLGIISKDSGEVSFFDEPECISSKDEIGVVLGEDSFPDMLNPIQVNKMMKGIYSKWDEEKYFDLLQRFDLPEKKALKAFSRGMKVKLSIAVALSHNARLLILDEPTNGLDPVIRDEIVDIFYEFTRNPQNSVLISSHIVSDLEKLCDYIAFLHRGKLVLCEEKDRLLEQYGIIHCTAEELKKIDSDAIKGEKVSPYGVEAVVERRAIPAEFEISPVGVEELFVLLVKGAR